MPTVLFLFGLRFDDNKIFIKTDGDKNLWQSLLWYPHLTKNNQLFH
jgi:hypothetical protein